MMFVKLHPLGLSKVTYFTEAYMWKEYNNINVGNASHRALILHVALFCTPLPNEQEMYHNKTNAPNPRFF